MPGRALLRPAAVVVLAAGLAASGCTSTATTSTESTASTTVTEAPAAAPGSAAAGGGSGDNGPGSGASASTGAKGGGSTGGGSTGGGAKGGGTGSSGGESGTKSTSNAPAIAYFRVADKPSCPAGTSVNPIAGSPVLVEWKASNVDSVALSIDGPGIYADDYPPAGSEVLNFPCSGGEGDIQKHTYTLTVRNSHGKQTKTIVVSAPVHDVPRV
ncbi:hypothetical protein C5N14_10785 [Micromonospora sp. MW-13]|uniref:hypothetical protein n=1 Tax=unclassified Micromonospora TaxID=2617518 RepID=UPI000EC40089|nr:MULTISPECIES: hypothetical protein [unclassified Micromonospora]MCX4469011.1 hypothetical protein [Micromonospora sp. NBC_01655]RGC69027.1 hypothetical protein C5N14_10785 [Micromonospora sp. MW-13]